ncbi:MAG: succinate dehydrogenase, cytochrome b556 subunit [Pseudomonadota bacterium]
MNKKRPVNLDIGTIQLPLAALTSITHRISGVIVFVGIAILLYLFEVSLASEADFDSLSAISSSFVSKFIVWGILTALAYHMVAGCKHLLMDMGIGETKEGGPLAAKITIVVSVVLAVLIGVWLW